MDKEVLKLTDSVYKILEYFPESDPLKNRIKDKALFIMESIISSDKNRERILEEIDVLLGYFWIAEHQRWLNSVNFLIIKNGYEKIIKESLPDMYLPKKSVESVLTGRKEKIIEFLEKNEKAQVSDLLKILPKITKRTVRRDLDELLQMGKIVRTGEFNQVSYQISKMS